MGEYTAKQYAAQHRLMEQVRWSVRTGLCPVCKRRPVGRWPDGVQRAICGEQVCEDRWLRMRPERGASDE